MNNPKYTKKPELNILEQTENTCLLELKIPASLIYFQGHFNNHQILAGVVQIDWVILFAREYLQITKNFAGMKQIKFQSLVYPDNKLNLFLSYKDNSLNFKYFVADKTISSGKIIYE